MPDIAKDPLINTSISLDNYAISWYYIIPSVAKGMGREEERRGQFYFYFETPDYVSFCSEQRY
jgi:hypothetical protein